jgi:hypothetical protein
MTRITFQRLDQNGLPPRVTDCAAGVRFRPIGGKRTSGSSIRGLVRHFGGKRSVQR